MSKGSLPRIAALGVLSLAFGPACLAPPPVASHHGDAQADATEHDGDAGGEVEGKGKGKKGKKSKKGKKDAHAGEGHAKDSVAIAGKPRPPAAPMTLDRGGERMSTKVGSDGAGDLASLVLPAPYSGKPVAATDSPEGVHIEDFSAGSGDAATEGSRLLLHYTGYLKDGTVFDSSVERNEPFRVVLGEKRVVPGWEIGLIGVRKGMHRVLRIPPELAYKGTRRGKIPPWSELTFTIEVLDVGAPFGTPKGEEAYAGAPVAESKVDGIKITDYVEGTGEAATEGNTLHVHYTGKLTDGTVFDSSVPRAKVFSFPLGQGRVIKGWDKGLEGLKVGGLRKLEIPADLAYGDKQAGSIPPNSPLTFTIELMGMDPPTLPPTRENTPPRRGADGSQITDPGKPGKPDGQ